MPGHLEEYVADDDGVFEDAEKAVHVWFAIHVMTPVEIRAQQVKRQGCFQNKFFASD